MATDDDTPDDDFESVGSDLSAALNDLLSTSGDFDTDDGPGPTEPPRAVPAAGRVSDDRDADLGDVDLSALEDAVAELGLDVDEEPGRSPADAELEVRTLDLSPEVADQGQQEKAERRPAPGLDLTELPPPAAARPGADDAPMGHRGREMPPLGEATADDLFGPLDDDEPAMPSSWVEEPDDLLPAPASETAEEPSLGDLDFGSFEDPEPDAGSPDEPAHESDVESMTHSSPMADADHSMADVVAFTAHGGKISGEIRDKAKKLFSFGR